MMMARFNKPVSTPRINQPIVSTANPLVRTANNAPGFTRDAKSELFVLAVNNFVGMDTFYEAGVARDQRFLELVRDVARSDPQWMTRFLPWLRNEANMRTASLVGALESAITMCANKIPGGRALVNSVLARADEPGEAIGYMLATYGRKLPKPIKRGLADAATRMYNEYNTLKYDTASKAIRFGDVLELTHPAPGYPGQGTLFKYLIDRRNTRHKNMSDRDTGIPSSLTMIHANAKLRERAASGLWDGFLIPQDLKTAGMTWEDVLSLAGNKIGKKDLWEALIPTMGYMALLRNLRNFDEAGVAGHVSDYVKNRLGSPSEVAKSRQLPMRFLSAFRAVSNVRWHEPLEHALQHSLANIPEFKGRTLILIDTSGSMREKMSDRSELARWDAAAIFGLALSQRCDHADVVSFSNRSITFPLRKGASLLVMLEAFRRSYLQGGGTATEMAVRTNFNSHDRVVILTDEQANYHNYNDVAASVPDSIAVITFNLAGYRAGHAPSGTPTRITIGGLSDSAFKLLPALQRRAAGQWPF
jgi:hypothetical protein